MHYAYKKFGKEETILLTRSNKSAVQLNEFVRRTILYQEDEISSGDLLMIVRNNYHWLDEDSPAGFLANGDFVEIMKIKREEEMHGQRFLDVTLRLCDYDDHPPIEAKILLETLHSAESALGKELNTLKMAQEVLGKKGGSYGELGTPASIGGKKGGLVTGANIVPKTIQKGGSALLLMAMADAAKAATEGNMAPSKELGFDLATGAGMAKMLGGPAALAASMAFGSAGLNPNEEKELAYRRKVGAGRGIAPPSAYMR
jgi:hypothetical protein